MGSNPSGFKGCDQCPVETVSFGDVKSFIAKLNALNDGFVYRLPTEAEWEFAARAGSTGPNTGDLVEQAWTEANAEGRSHPVGQLRPNAWGLYDMLGNVWEWVYDWYGPYDGAQTDPTGRATGASRCLRGGSWIRLARNARPASRGMLEPGERESYVGFRLVRTAK